VEENDKTGDAKSYKASVLQSYNTRVRLSDRRAHISSDKHYSFCGARADERATESSATVLFLGGEGGSSSI